MDSKIQFKTVDEYISFFPERAQKLLIDLRETIKKVAPEAEEIISYNMPALKIYGRILSYYAAHKEHIGFYPGSAVTIDLFKEDLLGFETSKGTIKFPIGKSIPKSVVKKIIKYRLIENLQKSSIKKKK